MSRFRVQGLGFRVSWVQGFGFSFVVNSHFSNVHVSVCTRGSGFTNTNTNTSATATTTLPLRWRLRLWLRRLKRRRRPRRLLLVRLLLLQLQQLLLCMYVYIYIYLLTRHLCQAKELKSVVLLMYPCHSFQVRNSTAETFYIIGCLHTKANSNSQDLNWSLSKLGSLLLIPALVISFPESDAFSAGLGGGSAGSLGRLSRCSGRRMMHWFRFFRRLRRLNQKSHCCHDMAPKIRY